MMYSLNSNNISKLVTSLDTINSLKIQVSNSLNLNNDNQRVEGNFVFEIQKNNSSSLDAKIFNENNRANIKTINIAWSKSDDFIINYKPIIIYHN